MANLEITISIETTLNDDETEGPYGPEMVFTAELTCASIEDAPEWDSLLIHDNATDTDRETTSEEDGILNTYLDSDEGKSYLDHLLYEALGEAATASRESDYEMAAW